MYSAKYDSIENVGPTFEELSSEEMGIIDGGGTPAVVSKATIDAAMWTNTPCLVSATVVSCTITGAYILKRK
ncbi:hypothetical protein [Lachnospira pectinoschiza]|uniref:Uncharacterized protein n=1 Tax=Lachnospira pectinoschiza TaxID=28052 RepID=A0A1G9X1Z8_9FIRM|nr:hypothetical protein [Lachnospira pectinoschiza]SDM90486.1 hypothetical protein SAMN05216544_1423 [Lachnospira pectinoschiza]